MNTASNNTGVYCLANDEVLEWFQAFVRSFRKYNPTLPITVIPYNASMSRLKALSAQFNFAVMDEVAASRFDSIADRVAGQRIAGGTFRKLSCFFGEYDTFFFLDSDIVVTSRLEPFLSAFETAACDFVYFDSDITMVYTPDFARQMVAEYGSPGFTSGTWIARRNSMTEPEILAAVDSGEKIREHFSIWGEQPFLNYLFDVTRRQKKPSWNLVPGITNIPSGRNIRHVSTRDEYVDAKGRKIPFIHWAGCEWPTMFRPEIFLRFRTLGMNEVENKNYRLNFYYRRLRAKLKERAKKFKVFAPIFAAREKLKVRRMRPAN